jgi:hypothetical protein
LRCGLRFKLADSDRMPPVTRRFNLADSDRMTRRFNLADSDRMTVKKVQLGRLRLVTA